MNFIPEHIARYIEIHTSDESSLLNDLYRETQLKVLIPAMISGKLQGRLLSMISKLCNPSRILEIGTYTGYSAICLAEGLDEKGKLFTIDQNEELENIQKRYWKKSGYEDKIIGLTGIAEDIIPTLNEDWDLVFIDADKERYIDYYEMILPNLKKGGIILADNVLWYGKVTEQAEEQDIETKGLQEFNRHVKDDSRVEKIMLPIRDGIYLIRKL